MLPVSLESGASSPMTQAAVGVDPDSRAAPHHPNFGVQTV